MKRFMSIISVIVLIVSLVLLFDKLFTPQPIQIVLESGQEVTTQTADYFTLTEVILLIVCSFLIGMTATFLFYNAEKNEIKSDERREKEKKPVTKENELKEKVENKYETILPLLKDDEKRFLIALKESNGEMLQNKLVLKLNLSKVKVTRVLWSLERKGLIVKERNGLTNNIKLNV